MPQMGQPIMMPLDATDPNSFGNVPMVPAGAPQMGAPAMMP